MANLYDAHAQWRERPADECYPDLTELYNATRARQQMCVAARVRPAELRFSVDEARNDIVLMGKQGNVAQPNNWSFTQLAELSHAPSEWIRRCPPALAVANINHALENTPREEMLMMWERAGNAGTVRAFTSLKYTRLWDYEVVHAIGEITQWGNNGWHRPPSYKDGETPRGLYAGDRNVFIFMVNEDRRIDDGSDGGLARGFFCWNSEVGQMSFGFRAFLYRYVCGNHIVWGAQELFNLRMVHIGAHMDGKAMHAIDSTLKAYLNASSELDEAIIGKARHKSVAKDAAGAASWLTQNPRKWNMKQAVEMVSHVEQQGGDPTNLWELVNAASYLSQRKSWADERNAEDRRAGRMLEVAF